MLRDSAAGRVMWSERITTQVPVLVEKGGQVIDLNLFQPPN